MRAIRLLVTVTLCLAAASAAQTSPPKSELPPFSRAYSAERDPFADGRAAIDLADRTDRRILIQVGGAWCQWCHALDRAIRQNRKLRRALHRHFVVLKVNVSDANDNADFLSGLPSVPGYPKLFVSRTDGTIVHARDPTALIRDGAYDAGRILKFLRRWSDAEAVDGSE